MTIHNRKQWNDEIHRLAGEALVLLSGEPDLDDPAGVVEALCDDHRWLRDKYSATQILNNLTLHPDQVWTEPDDGFVYTEGWEEFVCYTAKRAMRADVEKALSEVLEALDAADRHG